jgi:hypothetical protein
MLTRGVCLASRSPRRRCRSRDHVFYPGRLKAHGWDFSSPLHSRRGADQQVVSAVIKQRPPCRTRRCLTARSAPNPACPLGRPGSQLSQCPLRSESDEVLRCRELTQCARRRHMRCSKQPSRADARTGPLRCARATLGSVQLRGFTHSILTASAIPGRLWRNLSARPLQAPSCATGP